MMTQQSATSLALWLAKQEPELFLTLSRRMGLIPTTTTLSGFTDVLSAIGSGAMNAVKSVGTFLSSKQGLETLSSLGATYLTAKAQKQALNLQMAQVQAGQTAAPIETVQNASGQYEVQYTTQNGQRVPLTSQNVAQYMPAAVGATPFYKQTWFPFAVGGGLLMLFLIFNRR